jgi:STE24 endopeptidase
MNEDRASRYHRLKRRGQVLALAATAGLLALVIVTGASTWTRDLAETAAGGPAWLRPWLVVAVYVAMRALAHEAIAQPLAFVFGFLLERRYELSVEPLSAWARDHAKAVLIGGAFSLAGAEIVYAALRAVPSAWWLVSAAVFAAATVVLANLAPILLLPVFYRFTPLERDGLRDRLLALAARARVPALGVYEWGLGDRTRKANAALVGLGRTRRILVSDTLLSNYSDDEIEVILAHEMAHHVHRDMWKGLALETVLLFAGFRLADLALAGFGPAAGLNGPSDVAGLPILLLAAGGVSIAFGPLANAWSRRAERQADRYALALTARPAAFVSAMRRLSAQNLAEERPSRLVQWLFHTHPTVEERVETARRWESASSHAEEHEAAHEGLRPDGRNYV